MDSSRCYYGAGTCEFRAVPLGAPEVLLHAGAYTWGTKGSNDCAAPSSRIVDPAACVSAAAAAGKTYDGVVDEPAYPQGCAWCAPTHAHMTNYTRTRARAQVCRRRRQLRPAEHRAWRGSTGLHAALRASCAIRRAPFPQRFHPTGLTPSPLHPQLLHNRAHPRQICTELC